MLLVLLVLNGGMVKGLVLMPEQICVLVTLPLTISTAARRSCVSRRLKVQLQ